MKTIFTTLRFFAATLSIAILFSNCNKEAARAGNQIQQGNTIIEINAIMPTGHSLQLRYNNVINAPINVTVTFHLVNGQKKNFPVTIPAGYRKMVSWGGDNYINTLDYSGQTNSTGTVGSTPIIDGSWDISSVEITAVSCPDKEYGFKVLTGADDWNFYKPTGPKTTLSFIVNKDTVSYSDYDFNTDGCLYRDNLQAYSFTFFTYRVSLFSATASYPLQAGMTMDIPAMVYKKENSIYFGSQPDDVDSASNGSTLKLTITNVTDTYFDATFSGKLWSSRQADTLFISEGEIKNSLLPGKVDY